MKTTVTVAGMRSEHCKRAVLTALTPVPGILSAEATLGAVYVEHTGEASAEALRAALDVTGYVIVDIVEERRRLPLAPSHTLEALEP